MHRPASPPVTILPAGAGAALTDRAAPVGADEVGVALAEHFGLCGTLERLTGERDTNFRLLSADGRRFVVKLSHPAEPAAAVTAQTRALAHVAHRDPTLPTQRLVPARDGRPQVQVTLRGCERCLRVFAFLPGVLLRDVAVSVELAAALGAVLARLGCALRSFADPAADQVLLWDLKRAGELRSLLPVLYGDPLRAVLQATFERFDTQVAVPLGDRPPQAIHADFNPYNVLVDAGLPVVTGVLDFGDMVVAPVICDVAVGASYLLTAADPVAAVAAFVAGYSAVRPLDPAELRLLPDLMATRQAMTVLITEWRARSHPDNAAYILRNNPAARRGLVLLDDAGRAALTARFLALAG